MLRVAVVGVGWAGSRHVEAIRELGRDVQVHCLVDSDASFLSTRASELRVERTYTDYDRALADSEVDVISICTPHRMHEPMALAAMRAGKHVMVEKPMAVTVAEATRMIACARENRVKLYVAENAVYTPMARFLRHQRQSGEAIGEMTFASFAAGFRAPDYGYAGRRRWLSTPELGGSGIWLLQGIHSMAQLRYALGELAVVYLREHRASSFVRSDVEGSLSGLLTLESGVNVAIHQTAETRLDGTLRGYTIYGDRGTIRATDGGYQAFTDGTDQTDPPIQPYREPALSSYALEWAACADYVAGRSFGPTTGESERHSLAIVEAGYESIASGQPVDIRERFGDLGAAG